MIEAVGIAKRYGSLDALRPLTLRVEAGEVFGFLGPNGAGKSTTTKIFCGLIRPTQGRASVGGFDVVRQPSQARRLIGYVPEKVPIYKAMTAREFLLLFARLTGVPWGQRRARVRAALDQVGLADVERRPVGKFSKGMVQRLGIARALLSEPKVLFFDEPSSGLDPTGRREIRTLIQTLGKEGRTVFLCSHDLAEVQAVCHRVGFIREGQLIHTQKVGETSRLSRREFRIEVPADAARAVKVLAATTGVKEASVDGDRIKVLGAPDLTRVQLAAALQRAGVLWLGVEEIAPNLDALYRQYVETGTAGAKP